MVVSDQIHNIMGGIESAGDVRLHNHRRKLKQRFDIVKKLGQGTYGKVQLGINKETGQEVAIKTIRKCKIETEADLIRIRREIQIMSSVRHPNIIHIYEVFENREKMVLVMEYAAGGELYDYLSERKILTEIEARRIFRQIATAVYYCHKHKICHRDLKLENILLDEVGNAKIADFGLSNVFSYSSLLSTFCGSPLYASPEIVKGTPYLGPEVDCWSLGVLLYTLVYGAMPFDGSNFKRLVKQISQGDYFEPKNPSPASPLIADMLNVNPARRADIQAICNHWWINETYSEICLDVAEELASQTPVRLDLLLSLTTSTVNGEKLVVDVDQTAANKNMSTSLERPIRSQSLGSITPSAVLPSVPPPTSPETKELISDDRKSKAKKKERSHSKTTKKERSRSRSRKSSNEGTNSDTAKPKVANEEINSDTAAFKSTPLVNSGTLVISKPSAKSAGQIEPSSASPLVLAEGEPESTKEDTEPKLKPVQRRKSKVFEVAEKFSTPNEKPSKSAPPKKIVLPGINVDDARKEFEKRTSVVSGSTSPPKKTVDFSADTPPVPEEPFPLASTVALNKLVESAFRDEPEFDLKALSSSACRVEEDKIRVAPKLMNSNSTETNNNKAATLPRRRTSRAEIHLVTPQFPPDNYKTEVEHFVNKPAVNHKTEIIIPVSGPLPPKPLSKIDGQFKEHVIPIQMEQESIRKFSSTSPMWSTSKSSLTRTSSSSLSRQSTVESDSGSTVSTGEQIRKSPREVIIPIAMEGGGYLTPQTDTLARMSSTNEGEGENNNDNRCFTLRSTKRRQPEHSPSAQLDTADSLSSDEDDNFQLLTAENLFSTLLSRVRSLTQRLNNDEMRRSSSSFPRSLFTQHGSLFDNLPSRRLSETRSFNRTENAPWRRSITNNTPKRADSIRNRYSYISEERVPPSATRPSASSLPPVRAPPALLRRSLDDFVAAHPASATNFRTKSSSVSSDTNGCSTASFREPLTTAAPTVAQSEARQKLNNILAKHRRSSSSALATDLPKLHYSKSMPTTIADPAKRAVAAASVAAAAAVAAAHADAAACAPQDEKQLNAKPPRKSRFLRPDFYDTPREESKYVIKNETVRAFRERSLSRQRDVSRNRSQESFVNGGGSGASASTNALDGAANTNALGASYTRSKTCLPADRLETNNSSGRRDYRRIRGEDVAAAVGASLCGGNESVSSGAEAKSLRPRSMMLPTSHAAGFDDDDDDDGGGSSTLVMRTGSGDHHRHLIGSPSKRKSMLLQNELENEIRKTQNMNTKLNGLMVALNDAESQYGAGKSVGRLCGASKAADSAAKAHANDDSRTIRSNPDEQPPKTAQKATMNGDGDGDADYDKLSLLEKKLAYLRRLQSGGDQPEAEADPDAKMSFVDDAKEEAGATPSNASTSAGSAAGGADNDASSATTPPEEGDSDAWSLPSDAGVDSWQFHDNVNDRIRRRSFYSRFNVYRQKSTGNATRPPKGTSSPSPSPSPSYARSLSADHRPRAAGNSKPPEQRDARAYVSRP